MEYINPNDYTVCLVGPDGNPVSRLIGHPTAGYQPLELGYSDGLVSTPSLRMTASPTAGYVLTADADGDATWQAVGAASVSYATHAKWE